VEIKFTRNVLTIITAMLPGKAIQFLKDKGMIYTVGHPSKEVVVYHPGLPGELKIRLLREAENCKQTVSFMEHPNFEGCSEEEIQKVVGYVYRFFQETNPAVRIHRSENSNLLGIFLPNVDKKEDDVLDFVFSFLKSLKGLNLAFVTVKNACFRIESDVKHTNSKLSQEQSVITASDVTDLQITIENAKTVEDFLKSIGGA
jgi:hypothetical protein